MTRYIAGMCSRKKLTGRRMVEIVALMVTMGMAVAGCGGSSSSSSTQTSASAGLYTGWQLGGTPVHGGKVVVDAAEAPSTLNPFILVGDIKTVTPMYDELFELVPGKKENQPVLKPALAQSYTASPDHLTYTLHIRPGVRFSNGQQLTGEDVVFSLKQQLLPTGAGYFFTKAWKSVSLAGPMTVQIKLRKPQPALIETLDAYFFAIVSKNVYQREGSKTFGLHPIGTGPFMLKSASPGFSTVTYERNPYYWRHGEPYLNELVFNQVENDNARILGVRTGAAAVAEGVPYTQVSGLKSTPGVRMLVGPEWGATYNWFNREKAPFNETDVRQALLYATPVNQIIKAVYKGLGTPANSLWGRLKYWDPHVPLYPYDIAKAREMLKKSSVPHGFAMTMEVAGGETQGTLLASILQSAWAKIGVHATIRTVSATSLNANFFAGKYQFTIFPPEAGAFIFFNPDGAIGYFSSTESGFGPPASASFTAKIDRATTSTSEAERAKLWPELQYQAYREEALFLPIANLVSLTLTSDALHGFQLLPNLTVPYQEAWLTH